MVTIKIGSGEQQLETLDEGWLLQQINRRRRDGERVCVIVEIDDSPINLILRHKAVHAEAVPRGYLLHRSEE